MEKSRVLIGVPTYDGRIGADLLAFAAEAATVCCPTFLPEVHKPTDVARNSLVGVARSLRIPYLVMVDADATPVSGTMAALIHHLETATEPGVFAVPYCVSPNHVGVQLGGRWLTVSEAEERTGVGRVENIGTHCIAYDIRVFDQIEMPYFDCAYNESHGALLNTEDVVCHAKLHRASVPIFCLWDFWASHDKAHRLTRPGAFDIPGLARSLP